MLLNVLFGALPALVTIVVGPLVGAWSDRTRTRMGRRIPFLLATAPLVAISLAGLAYAVPMGDALVRLAGASQGRPVVGALAAMVVCWTVFESATLIGNALFVALINDTVPHRLIGRFFGLFRIVSLAVGAGFFYFAYRYPLMSIMQPALLAIAACYLGGFLALCLGVREPDYPPPALPGPAHGAPGEGGYGRRSYALLLLGVGLAAVAVLPVNVNSYQARLQFGVSQASFGEAIAITYAISILLAWPLGWLADRYHPLYLGLAALACYALTMLAAAVLMRGAQDFVLALVVHGVLAGTLLSGTAALLPALLPRAHFSQLAALSASVSALMTITVAPATGAMLNASGRDFRLVYLAGGLLALAGSLVWWLLIRRYRRQPPSAR